MHELSIALSIIDIASEEAERHGGKQVCAVHIKLGPLAGVVKEALLSAFELAREQSPLAESRLVIEDMPIIIHCKTCNSSQPAVSVQSLTCASCSTPSMQILGGQELEITALEVEE